MAKNTITPELLLQAYKHGLFPMADSQTSQELHWYDPPLRGIIPLDNFHIPARLQRTIKQQEQSAKQTLTINKNFRGVMEQCANTRASTAEGTWISGAIIDLYEQLHHSNAAHSIEYWVEDKMVGGLYGVHIGGAFFGESMFSTQRDASKIALAFLLNHLREKQFLLCDTQYYTNHLGQFGAVEVPRVQYHKLLQKALMVERQFN